MQEADDIALLRQYTEQNSEEAFATLVSRHVNKVYSVALRHTRNPHQAEEITQAVFVILTRKSRNLGKGVVLSGWLYETARRTAVTHIRSEIRRGRREQEAVMQTLLNKTESDVWPQIAPLLDAAMAALSETDRHAVVLRFFDGKSMREVGAALGASEDAAKMRLNRSVEKLRTFFVKRGVVLPATALTAAISAHSVQAAPAGLAAAVTAAALSGTTITTTAVIAATKTIAMTTLQKALVTATVAALAAAGIYEGRQNSKLRDDNQNMRQQLIQQAQLSAENERLSHLITEAARTNSAMLPPEQFKELLRLRSEVGRLGQESRELARVKLAETQTPANRLRREMDQMPEKNIPELQLLDDKKWNDDAGKGKLDTEDGVRETLSNLRRAAKIKFALKLSQALNDYARANNGQLPNNLAELNRYLDPPVDEGTFQRYELLQRGSLGNLPPGEPVIAEKAPVDEQYDTLFTIGTGSYTIHGVGQWNQMAVTNTWNVGPQ